MLKIYDVALVMAGDAATFAEQIERRDADLARQLRRAMQSVVLNIAEALSATLAPGVYSRHDPPQNGIEPTGLRPATDSQAGVDVGGESVLQELPSPPSVTGAPGHVSTSGE